MMLFRVHVCFSNTQVLIIVYLNNSWALNRVYMCYSNSLMPQPCIAPPTVCLLILVSQLYGRSAKSWAERSSSCRNSVLALSRIDVQSQRLPYVLAKRWVSVLFSCQLRSDDEREIIVYCSNGFWIVCVNCSSVCTKACWIRNGSVVMCVLVEWGEDVVDRNNVWTLEDREGVCCIFKRCSDVLYIL